VGHGFGLSSSGDSPPAPQLDTHGPSIYFAPTVSVCGAPSAAPQMVPAVLPALCFSMVPACNLASVAMLWPPAEPPPTMLWSLTSSNTPPTLISPAGSLMALLVHDGLLRPFPFDLMDAGGNTTSNVILPDSLRGPLSVCSVNHVVTCLRVFGFCGEGSSYARINLTAMASSESPGSLIDGGANICLTGNLGLLTDVVAIPPMPISVALQGETTVDDYCTARGKILLQLDDGSIYWQDCYYSKNVVEMIVSPQAIVDLSDVFQSGTSQSTGVGTLLRDVFSLITMMIFAG
jgi:hypothetical protein